mgnify:CR=1 FL=1
MGDQPASPGVRWRIRRFDEIDSTNRYALDAARAGEPPGLVVVADHQQAGRGRRGRAWAAPAGSSLLVSILLAPPPAPDRVQLLTMATGLALVASVRSVAGFDAELKWPNDLVVGDRKLAGLLAETDVRDGRVRAVVVGIGCNVTWEGYPDWLAETATACDREAGHPVDRGELLDVVLDELARRLADLGAVAADYRARLGTLGRAVRVELATGVLEGVATGIDDDGRLVVTPHDGAPVVVAAGDVVHLRPITDRGPTTPRR